MMSTTHAVLQILQPLPAETFDPGRLRTSDLDKTVLLGIQCHICTAGATQPASARTAASVVHHASALNVEVSSVALLKLLEDAGDKSPGRALMLASRSYGRV